MAKAIGSTLDRLKWFEISRKTAGTPLVVNGISCMHCHQNGMIAFRDSVRNGLAVFGDVRRKAFELYPPVDEMDRWVQCDSAGIC